MDYILQNARVTPLPGLDFLRNIYNNIKKSEERFSKSYFKTICQSLFWCFETISLSCLTRRLHLIGHIKTNVDKF